MTSFDHLSEEKMRRLQCGVTKRCTGPKHWSFRSATTHRTTHTALLVDANGG